MSAFDKVEAIHEFSTCEENSSDMANTKINNEYESLIIGAGIDGTAIERNFDGIIHSLQIYDVTNDG